MNVIFILGHQTQFLFPEEVSPIHPPPGEGENHQVIASATSDGDGDGLILMPLDGHNPNDANGHIGREGSASTRSTSRAESVEIRFQEPEVVASDTGANRAEDIPIDVGGNFG